MRDFHMASYLAKKGHIMLSHLIPRAPDAKSGKQFCWFSTRAEIALILVTIVTSIKLYYMGPGNRIVVLFVGSALSVLILYALSHPSSIIHRKLKTLPYGLCCYIPYLFGLYLFFFEGFWRLAKLLQGFNYFEIALAAFFFIGGNMVVSAGYMAMVHAESENKKQKKCTP